MPRYIPDSLEWDVTALEVGDSVRVEEIEFENITILTDPHSSIATVVAPRVEKEPVAIEEEALEGEEAEGEEAPEEGEEPSEESEES